MDLAQRRYTEKPLVKTKIIATVGPATATADQLRELMMAGVDILRLNFAHGTHAWMQDVVASIRSVSAELERPIGILADLAGPKIRLGDLPAEGICCREGGVIEFVREPDPTDPTRLTSTYARLIDDLQPGDQILLADGTVCLRVVEKPAENDRVVCKVEREGRIGSKQGINLPGTELSLASLTDKDRDDLAWAVQYELDFIGLSFVRRAQDIRDLRQAIEDHAPDHPPQIIAKIEKMEAVTSLESILDETDAVMVARGDLGVEVDIARVPILQKRVIRLCNQHRIPVITATQMLDSMQTRAFPTRAEASDVANAVLDGSDAVMLSGETAVGEHPLTAVEMMSRIAREAERLIVPSDEGDSRSQPRFRAKLVTEAVTLGAGRAAEHLEADLIAVATHSGKTALAISKQRSLVPVVALSDRPDTARRMCLYWGVTPLLTDVVGDSPESLIRLVVRWGKQHNALSSGSRIVLVGSSNWSAEGHDLMLVHAVG